MNDEEVAFRIVRLYFEEIARLGFKRQLDLDQMINSYFYTLKKVQTKDTKMVYSEKPTERTITTVTTETNPMEVVKETTTTVISEKPRDKSITDIIEEK